jgi:hypothetical protein
LSNFAIREGHAGRDDVAREQPMSRIFQPFGARVHGRASTTAHYR